MAKTFHKFPSIGKFSDLIKMVHQSCKYHDQPVPTLRLTVPVKLHGTNAAVCTDGEDVWLQTRERVLPDNESHMGFREFHVRNRDVVQGLLSRLIETTGESDIQVYGEWCGGNVQKNVGLIHLDKMFVIFAVAVGVPPETGHRRWLTDAEIFGAVAHNQDLPAEIQLSSNFSTYMMEVDFNVPALSQNKLIDLTIAVEEDCPVSRSLLGRDHPGPLVGEGIVWTVMTPTIGTQRFKVKGEKHSASKVRVLAPVDEELVKGINEFVEYAATENRLAQGIDKLRELGLDPMERKSIADYVRWVVGDVLREEMDVIANSGLETKQVTGPISRIASAYIKKWQDAPSSSAAVVEELAEAA